LFRAAVAAVRDPLSPSVYLLCGSVYFLTTAAFGEMLQLPYHAVPFWVFFGTGVALSFAEGPLSHESLARP
jgi:hypothetical protein